jgi:ADP-ribosylation factor-like protein 3
VYVIDSADQSRLNECVVELGTLLKEPKLQGVPLLVFANKQDLMSAMDSSEICDALSLNDDRAFQIQACSAKTGSGLNEGLEWLVLQMNDKEEACGEGK